MGVYIKGMEMPTDCALLLKIFPAGSVGVPVHLNWAGTMVVNDAEAIPVPLHGRLIDADAFIATIRPLCEEDAFAACTFATVKQLMVEHINKAPTIIPAEEG